MTNAAKDIDVTVDAEWAPQKAIWTAWPATASEWNGDLQSPRRDVAALVRALSVATPVRVLVNGDEATRTAREDIGAVAELVPARYGDIWLRDTGAIFARMGAKKIALRFKTNGWGGKYELPDDAIVGDVIARLSGTPVRAFDFVLEGGAVDHDGEGTILTTRQTLLNANRNGWTKLQAEAALRDAFGARKVIWIDEGLKNDHTDGHIDNLARFIAPGEVVCQAPAGDDDPNAQTLDATAAMLDESADAAGRKLTVHRIPGVGLHRNAVGEISPASYMNFVISNGLVVVPTYGTKTETAALAALQAAFKRHKVVGAPSKGLLGCSAAGGGSFHCITQQEPV